MSEWLRRTWERLRSHFLFLPASIALLAMALAVALVEIDRVIDSETFHGISWIFTGGPEGARAVMSTIANSMAQLAGITFSVTIVALALRSQQFGPRLLRNFTRDPANQVVLGVFVGTFTYALLVLRTVRGVEDREFVPVLAVTGGIVLALLALAAFIYFIDKIIDAIQATSIIAQAAEETTEAIDRLFPERLGEAAPEQPDELPELTGGLAVRASTTGYIQDLDGEALMARACEHDVMVRMEHPIGGFVVQGGVLLTVYPPERATGAVRDSLEELFAIGRHRSLAKDPEFGIRQIVDVAVKALSPSMNDPSTAVSCVHYLSAVLIRLAARRIPAPLRRDEGGALRVLARSTDFRSCADLAFDQIREYARTDVAVTLQLLQSIERLAHTLRTEEQRDVLETHVWKISRGSAEGIGEPVDREAVNRRLRAAMEALGRSVPEQRLLLTLASPSRS